MASTRRHTDNATPTPIPAVANTTSRLAAPSNIRRLTAPSPSPRQPGRSNPTPKTPQQTPPPRPARPTPPLPVDTASSVNSRVHTDAPFFDSPSFGGKNRSPNPRHVTSMTFDTPPRLHISPPWVKNSAGVLDSKTAMLMEKSPASLARNLANRSSSTSLSSMQLDTFTMGFDEKRHLDADLDLELITDIDDESIVDEELQDLLHRIKVYHNQKITQMKRLLEASQNASSSQLHALQAEVNILKAQIEKEKKTIRHLEMSRATALTSNGKLHESNEMDDWNLSSLLRVNFDERDVQRAVKVLPRKERRRLIGIILDCMIPADISEQIRLLEKYVRLSFDVVGMLPSEVSVRILRQLNVRELLGTSVVSKKWYQLRHNPSLWRHHVEILTAADPYPPQTPNDPSGWEPLFRRLYHRETNFRRGLPQDITFLNGHTNFCTTVILKGKRLISGSYDETIRFWDVDSGKESKCLHVKKPVSCIDFLAEEEVFACGFHDVGRVHLFSSVTYSPLQQLQGHLYGIRAVALSSKYLVSAGADKALVCWNWRLGTKIVRFGQQTNLNIGVQIIGSGRGGLGNRERVVSVTIDGIVRVFSIHKREMISQFKLADLSNGDPVLSSKIYNVGVGANNLLQWFAADGNQMTCATKNMILHLEWSEDSDEADLPQSPSTSTESDIIQSPTSPGTVIPSQTEHFHAKSRILSRSLTGSATPANQRRVSAPLPNATVTIPTSKSKPSLSLRTPSATLPPLNTPLTPSPSNRSGTPSFNGSISKRAGVAAVLTAPPKIVAVIETPDVAVGAMDPKKRRVVTATRFSSRLGADRKIYISTHGEDEQSPNPNVQVSESAVYLNTVSTSLAGAWAGLADIDDPYGPPPDLSCLKTNLPVNFKGLATPAMNPMSMALSHEEIVVGCADGTIYVMSMLGYKHKGARNLASERRSLGSGSHIDQDDEASSVNSEEY